ncbi:hypothetical protein ACFLWH_01775 [Chloroflexota bacterium]
MMWNPEKVERALFSWEKWRQSIVLQWIDLKDGQERLTLGKLRQMAGQELRDLGFPVSALLELYWVCCTICKYTLDDWTTFNNIVVPSHLLSAFDSILPFELEPGNRVYPPQIWDEGDIDLAARQLFGTSNIEGKDRFRPGEYAAAVFLPSHHEFYQVLAKFKGRTGKRKTNKRGRHPRYSDYLAVSCATLKDKYGMTYLKIAKKHGLPCKKPYESWRSDTAKYLVKRGRKVIQSLK